MLSSLALHALVLFALPLLQEAQRRSPAKLTARLAVPTPPEPVPQPVAARPPQPAPRPPVVRPPSAATAAPQPAPVDPTPAVAPQMVGAAPARPMDEPAFVVPATPVVPPPAAQHRPLAAGGVDPGSVAQFRLELMDVARRYKKYPRVALDNNWEGRVELRIAIGEDGAISSLTVRKGTGRTVLDEEAQSMMRTAKSKSTIPPALRGKAFVIEIPVDFSLKEEK